MKKLIVLTLLGFIGCEKEYVINYPSGYERELYKKSYKLAQESIILDGHVDVPYMLEDHPDVDITKLSNKSDFDAVRARDGGLDAPFMSIYIPAELQLKPGESKKKADHLIAKMYSIIQKYPQIFASANNPDDVLSNHEKGLISLPFGMENGSAIEDDISNVEYFYNKGIRYITLTHGKRNLLGDSSYDSDKAWNGLSPLGEKVVLEMNRLGIMVDISHVSDSTFYDVMKITKVPVIASHSSLRHFTPGMERNMSDDMVKLLGEKGGVIQINFGSYFLTQEANQFETKKYVQLDDFIKKNKLSGEEDPLAKAEAARLDSLHPYPFADISDVVNHIKRAVELAGIDHVGLGSDFDGVENTLPKDLKSVSDYPKLIYHLFKAGYSERDIKKILGENVLRVWQTVDDYAKSARK